MDPSGSFFRFLIGFVVFLGVSFGVTFAVGTYASSQDHQKQTATVEQALQLFKKL